MAAISSLLTLLFALATANSQAPVPVPGDTVRADSLQDSLRVVRRFPPIEVRALLHDLGSSETVHVIPGWVMRALPADGFADVLALQPGVVAQGEELHVRGGRAGETTTFLDGIGLNEPLRRRSMEPPLLGLRSANLVSGSPEAQYSCGLAGVLELRSFDPTARPSLAWRWQTALEERWFDRWAARASTPLRVAGLGLVAAGDVTLDDSWLPSLRSNLRERGAGIPFSWRAENRAVGWVKLAPIEQPQRFSAQVLVGRHLQRPYDPAWTRIVMVPSSGDPGTPSWQPGYVAYNAADHVVVTDERQLATLLAVSRLWPAGRAGVNAGWMRTRTVTSLDGRRDASYLGETPAYAADRYHVAWGSFPLYRESASDVLSLRGDAETSTRRGNSLKAGAGMTWEDVSMREFDNFLDQLPVDHLRQYHAYAPGASGYVQSRWQAGGLLVNAGLRAEYFTAGPEARHQTLPWDGRGIWSFSPRLGFAFPISVRDAFSMSYVRLHQAPGRDFLYDHREAITNRQPLGNPGLKPAEVVSYEAAVKHAFNPAWALQTATFYRDLFGQVGMRNFSAPGLPDEVRYVSEDYGHAAGFECSVVYAAGERRRFEVHYTFMEAWGAESRPEGDPYGPVLDFRVTPLGDTPLAWDRRNSVALAFAWPWKDDWTVSWSTAMGSPLPWTPKPIRKPLVDLALTNSRRLSWTETTNVNIQWTPPFAHGLTVGLEARNLFDNRSDRAATVDGYPNPIINTVFDDYGAYRTDTGGRGGAYWVPTSATTGYWVPVHDPRLLNPPRTVRISAGASW